MKKIITFVSSLFFCFVLSAQTTYTVAGNYSNCPTNNDTDCRTTSSTPSPCTTTQNLYEDNTIKISDVSINGNRITVTVVPCSGSFSTNNYTYNLSVRSIICECGSTNLMGTGGLPGGSGLSVSTTFPSDFTSGTRTYYALVQRVDGRTNPVHKYYRTLAFAISATTTAACTTPSVPTAVRATTGTAGRINLSWSGNGEQYEIAYRPVSQPVQIFSTTNLSHTFSGLTEGEQYCFSVKAIRGTCSSAYSPADCANAGENSTVNQVATPNISPNSQTFTSNSLSISMSCSTAGATIYYTTDGSTPTTNSARYTSAFSVTAASTTVKAIAVKSGWTNSDIASETYERAHPAPTTYNVIQFEAAPWQRCAEAFPITFKVETSDGSDYYVYHQLARYSKIPIGPYRSGVSNTITITRGQTTETGDVTYEIGNVNAPVVDVIESNGTLKKTVIIPKIQRYFIVDDNNSIDLSLKYVAGTNKYKSKFQRVNTLSRGLIFSFENLTKNLNMSEYTDYVGFSNYTDNWTGSLLGNSNLSSIQPGVFDYEVTPVKYTNYGNGLTDIRIIGQIEKSRINLTKISNYSSRLSQSVNVNKPVVVFVGGWLNELQTDATTNTSPNTTNESFSIMKNFAVAKTNNINDFQVWYIAQANNNFVQENAYVLGLALEKIKQQTGSTNIHLICHSKGGLDLRAMLGNLGKADDGTIFDYDNSVLNGSIKTLTFLATPHDGSPWADDVAQKMLAVTNWGAAGGVADLKVASNAYIPKILSKGTLPKNIKYFNVTGYLNWKAATLAEQYFGSLTQEQIRQLELEIKKAIARKVEVTTGSWALGSIAGWTFLTGERLLTSDGVVPFTSSYKANTEAFKWRGTGTSTLHQDFFNALHIDIHKTGYLLELDRCPCNQQETLLERLKKFVKGETFSVCGLDATKPPRLIGSDLPYAHFLVKGQGGTIYLGKTTEEGFLHRYTPQNLNVGDSILVLADNYSALTYRQYGNLGLCNKMPMFRTDSINQNVMYPQVLPLGGTIISEANQLRLKIKAANLNRFNIWSFRDSINSYRSYLASDSIVTVSLDTGMNYFNMQLIGNQNDTLEITKIFYSFPASAERDSISFTTTLNLASDMLGAKVYIDDQLDRNVTSLSTFLKLSNGGHSVRVSKLGYIDTILYVYDADIINLNMQRRLSTTINDSAILNLSSNKIAQFWNGITVKNSQPEGQITLKRYDLDYSNLRLQKQSETFDYRSLTPSVSWVKTAVILDIPVAPKRDSVYMLKINGNNYQKLPVLTFEYEEDFQKIVIDSFALNGNTKWVLMQRQRPLKNTASILRVHQSETLTLPLSDLFKDPDLLPSDMTYATIDNSNFDFTIFGDSIRIRHKTCNTGNLTFQFKAKHDELWSQDQFAIEVIPLSIVGVSSPARCFGTATGRITTTLSSNKPLYTYSWSNGATTANADSLRAGNYTVVVQDMNNCIAQAWVIVTEPTRLVAAIPTHTNVTCHTTNGGTCNGTAQASASGGVSGYNYRWSNNQTATSATNLCLGRHTVTLTDANGCTTTSEVVIDEPQPIGASFSNLIAATCDGLDGKVSISATGGTANYNYSWQNNETTTRAVRLAQGINNVTVTDANGCRSTQTVNIPLNNNLIVNQLRGSDLLCFGDNNGSIGVLASGPAVVNYRWNSGQTTPSVTGLGAGNYVVSITTPGGCIETRTATITQPTQLIIDSIQVNSSPCIPRSGTARAVTVGGTAPYNYLWSNSQTGETALRLITGSYTVTVTDANGCQTNQRTNLSVMPDIIGTADIQNVRCFGEHNGKIALTNIGGGNGSPYTFSLDNNTFQTASNFDSLIAGNYRIRIRDRNQCEVEKNLRIEQPADIVVNVGKDTKIYLGDSFRMYPSGLRVANFVFDWQPNTGISCAICEETWAKPFITTTYTLTVKDPVSGCLNKDSVQIFVENKGEIFVPNSFSPNNDGANDVFIPYSGLNVKQILKMDIFARNGLKVFSAVNIPANVEQVGWDGTFKGSPLSIGTYVYIIEVEFLDGTRKVFLGDINLIK